MDKTTRQNAPFPRFFTDALTRGRPFAWLCLGGAPKRCGSRRPPTSAMTPAVTSKTLGRAAYPSRACATLRATKSWTARSKRCVRIAFRDGQALNDARLHLAFVLVCVCFWPRYGRGACAKADQNQNCARASSSRRTPCWCLAGNVLASSRASNSSSSGPNPTGSLTGWWSSMNATRPRTAT